MHGAPKMLASLVFAVVLFTWPSSATHFRYWTMEWDLHSDNENGCQAGRNCRINVYLTTAWRLSAYYRPPIDPPAGLNNGWGSIGSFNWGDGKTYSMGQQQLTNVVDYDKGLDYVTWQLTADHTYANINSNSRYIIKFSSCCRISTLKESNSDKSYITETIITGKALLNGKPGPSSLQVPILKVGQGLTEFKISHMDRGVKGVTDHASIKTLKFSFSGNSGMHHNPPYDMKWKDPVNHPGVISWTPRGGHLGQYSLQHVVRSITDPAHTHHAPPLFFWCTGYSCGAQVIPGCMVIRSKNPTPLSCAYTMKK